MGKRDEQKGLGDETREGPDSIGSDAEQRRRSADQLRDATFKVDRPEPKSSTWIEDDESSNWVIEGAEPTRPYTRASDQQHEPLTEGESAREQGPSSSYGTTPENRYRVQSELGRGGMGVVVSGEDLTLKREVAIKVLRERGANDPVQVERFLDEARIQGRLDHPNICPVHEMGFDARGRPYFTMKRVRGKPLSQLLPDGPIQDSRRLAELLRIYLKVCNGIALAHARGVVHRDLKPANIMVGEFGEVLVMDWGLARSVSEAARRETKSRARPSRQPERSLDGDVLGTPAYMAPEQARGEIQSTGPASDIYALGGILFRILSGIAPHTGISSSTTLENAKRAIVAPMPPVALHIAPHVKELLAVAHKALALEASSRYATVGDLEADIEAFLDGRALSAMSYSPVALLRKWIQRHRIAVGAAAAVAILSLGAFGLMEWRARAKVQEELLIAEQQIEQDHARLRDADRLLSAQLELDRKKPQSHWQEANGELNSAALNTWYEFLGDAVAAKEAIVRLADRAPSEQSKAALNVATTRTQAISLCLEGANRAAAWGQSGFARGWIDRARSLGLDENEADVARLRIDHVTQAKVERDLDYARGLLAEARAPQVGGTSFLDSATTDLLRRKSPDMVRLLLQPEHVNSEYEWERRLSVEALGRMGDTRTKGAKGLDAVEELLEQLATIDADASRNEALGIARALGYLGDARAHEGLHNKRKATGWLSLFSRESAAAYRRIPIPGTISGSGSEDPKDPALLVDLGIRLMDQGELVGATGAFTDALKLDPTDEDARVNRGICHLQLGNAAEAVADHTIAIDRRPDAYNAFHNRGNAYNELRKYDLAIADYSECLRLKPDYAHALQGRAVAYRHTGVLASAIEDYSKALELDPKNASLFNNRGIARSDLLQYEEALSDYAEAIRLAPETTSAWMNRGYLLARTGRVQEGLADLDRAIELFPSNGQTYLIRGTVHSFYAGNTERALKDFNQAVELSPRSGIYYSERSQVHVKLEDYRSALADLDTAIALMPNYAKFHERRGIVLYYLGRVDDALQALDQSVKLDPTYLDGWWNRASVLQGAERFDEAALAYAEVTKVAPSHRDAYIRYGLMARKASDEALALKAYNAALEKFGDDAIFLGLRGDLHRGAGRLSDALADFDNSLRIDGNSASALWGRGMTHLGLSNRSEALADAAAGIVLEGESDRMLELQQAATALK
jgi:serine/threonine-protein kinase